ncbi:MAG: hypothetical protein ACREIB_02285 [Pseudomonadota bacterium]
MEIPFVGPSYNLVSRPSGVQRTINMVPVPEEPNNERTAWVLKDAPGLEAFVLAPVDLIAWLSPDALDSGGTATPGTTDSISVPATRTIFAGVVGYVAQTVIWSLDTSSWVEGTLPVLAAAPAGKTGVTFTGGGSPNTGTARLTATVNGAAAMPTLTGVVVFDDCEGHMLTWNFL